MTPVPVRTRSTIVFDSPFRLPGLDEVLPAGGYLVETELKMPSDVIDSDQWRASVKLHLHRLDESPGLARTLTVSLAEFEQVVAQDQELGRSLAERLLDEMLSDPMIRLIMASDSVSEEEIRRLWHSPRRAPGD